jgi:hypothetical protein
LDAAGNAVVVGDATSLTPTKGAYQSARPGPCPTNPTTSLPQSFPYNAFAAKLNASGALLYATYLTGSCGSYGFGLALDSAGDAYLAGETTSPDFPVTQNAMIAKFTGGISSGFVAKLSPAGRPIALFQLRRRRQPVGGARDYAGLARATSIWPVRPMPAQPRALSKLCPPAGRPVLSNLGLSSRRRRTPSS